MWDVCKFTYNTWHMDEDLSILHARKSANFEFLKEFMVSQLFNDIKHTTTSLGTSATTNASATATASNNRSHSYEGL